jgi:hypothetical protein
VALTNSEYSDCISKYSKTSLIGSKPLSKLVKVRIIEVLKIYVQGSYRVDFTCLFKQYNFILKLILHIIRYIFLS